jgi:hypothetical protein
MSVAIQFIDQPQVSQEMDLRNLQEAPAEPAFREVDSEASPELLPESFPESFMDNVALFEPAAETKLRRANEHIAVLQAEIWALREALAGAERLVRHKELLLANTRVREMELRAQFSK